MTSTVFIKQLTHIHVLYVIFSKDTVNECPGYDTKQFDGEVPLMLELWRM